MFRKVLIANRGEIAVRVMRTLREMGIRSVAVYSDADRTSLHVRMADEAAYIGPSPSAESYLRIDRILDAARKHGADAIHPGYGFLSENADFAAACEDAGIVFIGPSAESIRAHGFEDRRAPDGHRRRRARGAGHQNGAVTLEEARAFARSSAIRCCSRLWPAAAARACAAWTREAELESAFRDAASEAERSFGNAEVYVEKLIERPRHIEIQLLGDRHGNMVHLGERECSIQRRHQKVMEECPSPLVAAHPGHAPGHGRGGHPRGARRRILQRGHGRVSGGRERRFYFLEMNTRLQVEHPVTELVTGLDLVRLQLESRPASALPFTGRGRLARLGHRMPHLRRGSVQQFLPVSRQDHAPDAARWARACAWMAASTRAGPCPSTTIRCWPSWRCGAARATRPSRACCARCGEYDVAGIHTNIRFFRQILEDAEFRAGRLHTGFIDEFLARRQPPPRRPIWPRWPR